MVLVFEPVRGRSRGPSCLVYFSSKGSYQIASIFDMYIIVSPVRSTYGGYYGLVVVTPRPQTLHRSHDNLKNPYQIASIFYM